MENLLTIAGGSVPLNERTGAAGGESVENLLTIAGASVLMNNRTGAAGGESVENMLKCQGINAGIRSEEKVCLVFGPAGKLMI